MSHTRARNFGDLRAALLERLQAGGDEVEEDVSALLEVGRYLFGKQVWGTALFSGGWREWSEREATINHEDPKVVAWVQSLAAQANINGPDAQKLALLCSNDYVAQITRDHCAVSFTRSPFNSQVLRFYYSERCNRLICKSLLLQLCAMPHSTLGIKNRLEEERGSVISRLSGTEKTDLGPVQGAAGSRADFYAAERSHQRCFEMCLLLQHLVCLNHYLGAPRRAEIVSEMQKVLARSGEGAAPTLYDLYLRSKAVLVDNASFNYFRLIFIAWVCQSLGNIGPLAAGETLSEVLGETVYSTLASIEGTEGALVSMLLFSIEGSQLKHYKRVTQNMVTMGLTFLLYLLTQRYSPPPESVLAATAASASPPIGAAAGFPGQGCAFGDAVMGDAHAAPQGGAGGVQGYPAQTVAAQSLIPGVHVVDIFSGPGDAQRGDASAAQRDSQTFGAEGYSDVEDMGRLPFLKAPFSAIARQILAHTTPVVFAKKSEVQTLLLTRIALESRQEHGGAAEPSPQAGAVLPGDPDAEFLRRGLRGDALLTQLAHTSGWLFPSCIATTALLEIVTASDASSHDEWWARLSSRTTIVQPLSSHTAGDNPNAPPLFDGRDGKAVAGGMAQGDWAPHAGGVAVDDSQRHMAEMPEDSKWVQAVLLPKDGDCVVQVPDSLGNWYAPIAPLPSVQQVQIAVREVSALPVPENYQVFCLWQIPDEKAINGWLWMCMRIIYIFKIGRRTEHQADQWLTPYMELANAIIPLFHVMVCGSDPDPARELDHFCQKGYARLQEIESCLQELQSLLQGGGRAADGGKSMGTCSWSLPLIVAEVLSSLVEWQEAQCYQQRSNLVTSCSRLLRSLVGISRGSQGVALSVTESIVSSVRCLFQPGRQTARSPLLHLFWVVEAANKKCTCTRGILSLLSTLISGPDDCIYLKDDLSVMARYICEVFTDIGNQWYSSADEQWEMACHALQAIIDAIQQTRLPRCARGGVGAAPAQAVEGTVLSHLIHSNRMARAVTEVMARAASSIFEVDKFERVLPTAVANKVLLLSLRTAELGLQACLDEASAAGSGGGHNQPGQPGKTGQPQLPPLASLLCEIEPSTSFAKFGDKFTIPSLIFHVVASGGDDLIRVQAAKTFSLLCAIAPPGSLLRHVGYRAASAGRHVLGDLVTRHPAVATELHQFDDPTIRGAYCEGLLNPDGSPEAYNAHPEAREAWLDASRATRLLLSLLRMMASMVSHQPQLFVQAFFDKSLPMSDPLGSLLKRYVVVQEHDWENEPRPAVKEAVLALVVAALECREPCRSLVLSRTTPTLSIKIQASSPGIGDKLASEDRKSCPWNSMPTIRASDLKDFREALDLSVGDGGLPCLQFDASRSWPQCGFSRKDADLVDGPMSFIVGPLTAHPAVSHRDAVLKHAADVAKKSIERAGFTRVSVTASWALEKPVEDPEFWSILAEALAAARHQVGQLTSGESDGSTPEKASEMSWSILAAGHVMRSIGVAAGLEHLYPRSKFTDPDINGYDTAVLVQAVRGTLGRVLGAWGDNDPTSPTSGVLGMLTPTEVTDYLVGEGSLRLDGLLGQAAGLFYGSVKVPQIVPRIGGADVPRKRAAARPLSPSPRKSGLSVPDGSPKVVSPLVRPMMSATPTDLPMGQDNIASLFPATPTPAAADMPLGTASSLSPIDGGMQEDPPMHAQQATLYELLRKAEEAVHLALIDNGVAEELVHNAHRVGNASQVTLAILRGRLGSRSVSSRTPPTASKQMPGAFICMETLSAVYPNCTSLLRLCQELNDVVGLAAAAYYMLTSVSQVVMVLLRATCPFVRRDPQMLLPTHALLNPADWRQGGRSSLVFVLLQKCLLHPPREGGDQSDPAPLVTLLDCHIRAEASRLLTAMIAEVSRRNELNSDMQEDTKRSVRDRHAVNRHLVWQVYNVLQALHVTQDDNTLGIRHAYSRKGHARPGEADLLVSLCLLGRSTDSFTSSAAELTGDTAALAGAIFPHLHQYLSMEDLTTASPADLECYKAAFMALCTFGVPKGCERHAVQLAKTFIEHLRMLHRRLEEGHDTTHGNAAARGKAQGAIEAVERGQLILKGLQRMASCESGGEVLAEAGVVPSLASLQLFMPPAVNAASAAGADAGLGRPPGAPSLLSLSSPAQAPWCTLWQAILDVVSAAATPSPLDGVRKPVDPTFATHMERFVDMLGPRLEYLLSEQGLQQNATQEAACVLQLAGSVCRRHMAAGFALSATKPAFPWLLPVLNAALPSVRLQILGVRPDPKVSGVAKMAQGLFDAVGGVPTFGVRNAAGAGFGGAEGGAGGAAGGGPGGSGGERPDMCEADVRNLRRYCEIASQMFSVMRLHLVSFLPHAAPVGALGRASPPVSRLLEVIGLAAECKRQAFTDRLNELCKAAENAPEMTMEKLLKLKGYPFTDVTPAKMYDLREAILDECAAYWAPSAAVNARPYYTLNAEAASAPLVFKDMAVFGIEDELSSPAKAVIELVDTISERLSDLLEVDPTTIRIAKKGTRPLAAVKQAANALEQGSVLRQVYTACLELAAPTESQTLWASNVLQRLLNEKSGMQLTSIPGTVMRKRLYAPMQHLAQSGNTEEVGRAQAALALHCLHELRRQPESTPWLNKSCARLHTASVTASTRSDAQSKHMTARVQSTISVFRSLAKERFGTDLTMKEGI